MSSATTPHSPSPPGAPPLSPQRKSITLISHSMLFYWWPIWVLGYALAAVTYLEDDRLAIIPNNARLTVKEETKDRIDYILSVPQPSTRSLEHAREATSTTGLGPVFKPRISQKAWLGPVFCVVLLLTVVITNVPARGLWSFLVILMVVVVALIISLVPGGWDSLFGLLFNLHIYINMAGYLFTATTVFVLWLVSVFIFDQRTYMVVEPGQIRICEHVGASIRNIDSAGIELEKQRDDLFRHWLLGFFSGDLIIHLPDRSQIRLPNVLWIGWRLEEAQQLLREKAMVAAKPM